MQILLADDERSIAVTLGDSLKDAGHSVELVDNGNTALDRLRRQRYDLLITDIRMPGKDGIELLKAAKGLGADIEVIVITGHGTIPTAVEAIRHGAYDYVLKPFSVRELSARVKALLRRSGARRAEKHALTLGNVEIDLERQVVLRKGKHVRLSFREFEVLRCLAARMGDVVTREELLEEALGYSPLATSRAVDNLVVGLRKKLEANYHKPRHILTAYGIGYKLVP